MKITRTIETTKVTAQVYNRDTNTLETKEITLIGKVKDAEKAVKKELFASGYVFCALVDSYTESKLYALDEKDFIKYAECIGEGRK